MTSLNTEMFHQIGHNFMSGDTLSIASRFTYPTAIYLKEDTLIYHSEYELGKALDAYRDRLCRFDYRNTRARVDAISSTRGSSLSVCVNWQHLDGNGLLIEESCIRYLGELKPSHQLQIQLSEYLLAPSVCSQHSNPFFA